MSILLTSASAKALFETPTNIALGQKILTDENFTITETKALSQSDLSKAQSIVTVTIVTGEDPVTEEPITIQRLFEINHDRENIRDVLRRRLPRDAGHQLTIPGLEEATIEAVNELLEEYHIFLEPTEFKVTQQGDNVFHITALPHCVIFYGTVGVTGGDAVTDPLEVYEPEATGGETGGETGGGDDDDEDDGEDTDPPTNQYTFGDYTFDPDTKYFNIGILGASNGTAATVKFGSTVVNGEVGYNQLGLTHEAAVAGVTVVVTVGTESKQFVLASTVTNEGVVALTDVAFVPGSGVLTGNVTNSAYVNVRLDENLPEHLIVNNGVFRTTLSGYENGSIITVTAYDARDEIIVELPDPS